MSDRCAARCVRQTAARAPRDRNRVFSLNAWHSQTHSHTQVPDAAAADVDPGPSASAGGAAAAAAASDSALPPPPLSPVSQLFLGLGDEAPDIYAILRLKGRASKAELLPAVERLVSMHDRFRMRVECRGGVWHTRVRRVARQSCVWVFAVVAAAAGGGAGGAAVVFCDVVVAGS